MMKTQAAIEEIGKHGDFLPIERGISLPIIQKQDGKVSLLRLVYFTRTVLGEGTYITPPQYLGIVDMTQGEFRSLGQFPDELKPADLPPFPWIHNRHRFDKPEDIISEFRSIYELYDRLLPSFLDPNRPIEQSTIDDAKLYLKYFERHAEKPLMAYYEKLGGDFLKWVRSTSTR